MLGQILRAIADRARPVIPSGRWEFLSSKWSVRQLADDVAELQHSLQQQFTQEQRVASSVNWLEQFVIAAEHPLADDPSIQKVITMPRTVPSKKVPNGVKATSASMIET